MFEYLLSVSHHVCFRKTAVSLLGMGSSEVSLLKLPSVDQYKIDGTNNEKDALGPGDPRANMRREQTGFVDSKGDQNTNATQFKEFMGTQNREGKSSSLFPTLLHH